MLINFIYIWSKSMFDVRCSGKNRNFTLLKDRSLKTGYAIPSFYLNFGTVKLILNPEAFVR